MPEEEHIFAGDMVDSFFVSVERQAEGLELLVNSKCILLYGNHELSYTHKIPCSGRTELGMRLYPELIKKGKWKVAHVADNYVVTHAGISKKHAGKATTPDGLVRKLNKDFKSYEKRDYLFDVGRCRGGYNECGGPFWYDFKFDITGLVKFNQVFGHCSLSDPWEEVTENGSHHVCINSRDDQNELWVFDTKTKRIHRIP